MPSYSRTIKLQGRTSSELYEKVAGDIERFLSKVPLGKLEINRDSGSKTVKVKSSMAEAELVCKEGEICLNAKLSLLAAPFRSKLDDGIDQWLAKTFR